MELLAMLALLAVIGALILWPLLRRPDTVADRVPPPPTDVGKAKSAALSAIRELEFDYQTGKISPEDYAQLRARYEAKAVDAMTRPESSPTLPDVDEQIEAAIRAARATRTCSTCGQTLPQSARFCPACGAPVKSD